jgi:uncharacterized membrane protein
MPQVKMTSGETMMSLIGTQSRKKKKSGINFLLGLSLTCRKVMLRRLKQWHKLLSSSMMSKITQYSHLEAQALEENIMPI